MSIYETVQGWNGIQKRFAAFLFFSLFAGLFALAAELPAQAVTSVPTKMNFQGRVTNASGNILANGTYNMKFRIWSAASAGTQLWSEDRLVSATQGVTVTNGQFSVQLGSVTSLPASVFNSSSLYFEVELPTPATATTASPVWTEGAMTPRNQLATSAYAYNSETLDGLDSAAFGQLNQNNTFTGNNTFNGTLQGGSSLTLGTAAAQGSLVLNDGNGQTGTLRMADTAGNYTYTIPVTTASDTFCLATLANCGGISTIGSLDGTTADAKGAAIVGSTLYLQSASTANVGLVNTTTQSFAGNKTFTGTVSVNSTTTLNDTVTIAADKTIKFVGGATGSRPVSPGDGALFFDTTTKQLLAFANGKWQADRSAATKIIAASNSSQSIKDAADYVADGTGDETEINAALTAAADGIVYLSEGTYTAGATILVPNNTTLTGAGNNTLIQLADIDITDNLIENSDVATGAAITLRDFRIDGQKALNTVGSQYGIYLSNMGGGTGATARQGVYMTNVAVNNFNTYGVSLSSSSNGTVHHASATGNSSAGYHLNNADRMVLTGNKAHGNGIGFTMSTADNGTFTGNLAESNTSQGFSIGSSTNNTFTGNTTNGNSNAFYVSASADNVFTGNSIQAPTSNGFNLSLSANNNQISSNRIVNSGGSTTNSAIYIAANSDNNLVTNNQITDSSATSNNYAINLAINTVDTTYLSNNTLGTGTINDLGTGTIYAGQVDSSGNLTLQPAANINLNKNTVISSGSLTLGGASTAGTLAISDGSSNTGTIAMAPTAGNYTYTIPVTTANDTFCLQTLANCGSGGGISTVGALDGGTANATGATIVGSTFYLQSASASFAGLVNTTTQTFAGNKTFSGTLTVVSASNFSGQLTMGVPDTTGVLLVLDTKTDAGDPVGTAGAMYYNSSSGKFRCYQGAAWTDCIGSSGGGGVQRVTLAPEYVGGVLMADGTNNNVNVTAGSLAGLPLAQGYKHNFYQWDTTASTAQDYDIVINYQLPSTFTSFVSGSFRLWVHADSLTSTDATFLIKSSTDALCYTAAVSVKPTVSGTWENKAPGDPGNGCTFAANDVITFVIKPTVIQPSTNRVKIGELRFEYQ